MVRCIGLDMGYGFIKANDGREGFVFPSVVGEGSQGYSTSFGFAKPSVTEDIRINIGGRNYYLGDLAIRHSRIAHRGLSATRAEGDDIKILFLGALSLFCQETMNDFYVVTGLPPGRMHLADDLVAKLRGDHHVTRQIGQQQVDISVRVDRIDVVPQPLGTFWSEVLDGRGQLRSQTGLLEGKVGIIDVGFRTTDFATIVDGEYAPAFSRTVPIGISTGYDGIADALATQYGLERETYTLDKSVINGAVNVSGRRVDISDLRDQILGEVATKLLVEVRSLWQLEEYDTVLLTGGGAHVLERYLRPLVPQAVLVHEPSTANARGYFSWAYHHTQASRIPQQSAPEQQPAQQAPQQQPAAELPHGEAQPQQGYQNEPVNRVFEESGER